jgi:hypothetical protein
VAGRRPRSPNLAAPPTPNHSTHLPRDNCLVPSISKTRPLSANRSPLHLSTHNAAKNTRLVCLTANGSPATFNELRRLLQGRDCLDQIIRNEATKFDESSTLNEESEPQLNPDKQAYGSLSRKFDEKGLVESGMPAPEFFRRKCCTLVRPERYACDGCHQLGDANEYPVWPTIRLVVDHFRNECPYGLWTSPHALYFGQLPEGVYEEPEEGEGWDVYLDSPITEFRNQHNSFTRKVIVNS